jgi:hypothetical protein
MLYSPDYMPFENRHWIETTHKCFGGEPDPANPPGDFDPARWGTETLIEGANVGLVRNGPKPSPNIPWVSNVRERQRTRRTGA